MGDGSAAGDRCDSQSVTLPSRLSVQAAWRFPELDDEFTNTYIPPRTLKYSKVCVRRSTMVYSRAIKVATYRYGDTI